MTPNAQRVRLRTAARHPSLALFLSQSDSRPAQPEPANRLGVSAAITMAANRRRVTPILLLALILVITQTACTRDDVAAAVSTLAAQMQATLAPARPMGEASTSVLATALPDTLTTALPVWPTAQSPGELPTLAFTNPEALATLPAPTPTATLPSTPTPAPSATPEPSATPTPQPSPTPLPALITVDGGAMALIPGGFFQMGATADDLMAECAKFANNCRREWFVPSEPVHPILLAPFYIDSHEVTNDAFARFLNSRGGSAALCLEQPCYDAAQSELYQENGLMAIAAPRAQHPVTGVTWYGAAAFCEWRGARLPTEAEWEKAGAWDDATATARRYPWGDEFDGRRLNFCDANCDAPQANPSWNDAYASLAPVAQYEDGRSATGLYDMAGNVWEWVADWFDPAYYAASPGADPTGPGTGEQKVVRGASWYDAGYFTATAVRFPSSPANADRTLGFRCAANLP